jgi:hypothetical protein
LGQTVTCSGGWVNGGLYQEDVACSWRATNTSGGAVIVPWTNAAPVRQVAYPFLFFFNYTAPAGGQHSNTVTIACCNDRTLTAVCQAAPASNKFKATAAVTLTVNSGSRRRRSLTAAGLERQERLAAAAAAAAAASQRAQANQGWGGGWQPDLEELRREIELWKQAQAAGQQKQQQPQQQQQQQQQH